MGFVSRIVTTDKSLRDYLQVIVGSAAGRGLAFLNGILIARMLGPEQFGVFAFFFAVMMLSCLTLSSFDTAYIRHAKVASCAEDKRELLFCNLLIKTGLGLCIIGCVAIMGTSTATVLFGKTYARPLMLLGIGAGVCLNWVMTLATIYRETERFQFFVLISNVHTLFISICLVILWGLTRLFSLKTVIAAYVLSAFIAGILSFIVANKIGRPRRPRLRLFRTYIAWGKWMFLLSLVVAVFDRVDFLFLTRYLEPVDIGIYAAGVQLVLIISVTTGALNNVFVPRAMVALRSRSALRSYVREAIAPVIMIAVLIALLFAVAPFMITGLYGQQYEGAVVVVRIIAVGWLGAIVYLPFSFLFYTLDEPHTRFYLELSKLIVGLSALTFLVPLYGIRGAALAISLSLLLNALLSGLVLYRKLRQPGLYSRMRAASEPLQPAKEGT